MKRKKEKKKKLGIENSIHHQPPYKSLTSILKNNNLLRWQIGLFVIMYF